MEVYISDIDMDKNHPMSMGDSLDKKLDEVFPDIYFTNLDGVLTALLDEIVKLRKGGR